MQVTRLLTFPKTKEFKYVQKLRWGFKILTFKGQSVTGKLFKINREKFVGLSHLPSNPISTSPVTLP